MRHGKRRFLRHYRCRHCGEVFSDNDLKECHARQLHAPPFAQSEQLLKPSPSLAELLEQAEIRKNQH
jgi:hypothetical protein